MIKENINRLKKYLFLISIFFSVLIGSHILYIYMYDNAEEIATEWGTISEWIIWDFPHLNPLLNSTDYNKNILSMLYRSLLKYDFKNKSITSDLATCNIKNLNYIECYLENNIQWSNGKEINSDDVVATYNIIKNSDINPVMRSFLKDTRIESKKWMITFSNTNNDINFLKVFFQPIVPKEILDNIWNKELFWKFNPVDGIFSGPYKVEVISYDDSLWIQKLILSKNEYYKKINVLIAKYIYKFFRDQEHFLKHKDTINVFFDKNNIIWESIPRLNNISYSLHQYISLFLNEEKIKNYNLRNFILSKIDTNNILTNLWKWYKEAENAYLMSGVIYKHEVQNLNLENTVQEMWFYKKDFLLKHLIDETKKIEEKKIEEKINSNLVYISWSIINKKYNFIHEDNILISGITKDDRVEEVYVNEYKLSWFKKWNKDFFYRLKTDFKNISIWENNYKIYFSIWWKKELKEEFFITFSTDINKLKTIEDNFFKKDIKIEDKKVKQVVNEERKQKIIALNDTYYYDYNLNKFRLKLYYINDNSELISVSNTIKNSLETYGIIVDSVWLSLSELNKKITSWEKDYDIILVGIDLWIFDFNIYPYFHSSQSQLWFNFSNLKNLKWDILLEELKTNFIDINKRIEIQKQIMDIIYDKKIFKTLYKKINTVLIDKNIKNFKLSETMPYDLWVNDSIENSYVTNEKKINFKEKSFYNFLDFILKILKNEW